jgi:16S rRNA G966 N2-methylase RsmD
VLFVESDGRAAQVIRDNIGAVGLPGGELVTDRVDRLLERGPGAVRYDLVVADPPYRLPEAGVTAMLAGLASRGWLAPGAVVAVERATRSGPVGWPPGYLPDRSRRYGDTTFWYGLAAGAQPADQPAEQL